jgi:hypothetical protein
MELNRRTLAIQCLRGVAGLVATNIAFAEAPLLLESNSQAARLGYKADATKVDVGSFPRYAPGQNCSNCRMFKAQESTVALGSCAIFSGKLVSGQGWCDGFTSGG